VAPKPGFELVPGGDDHSFRLRGELDLAAAVCLLEGLRHLLRPGEHIRLELSDLVFIDSSGLHALVRAADALAPGGSLILDAADGEVARVFRLVRADLIPGLEIAEPVDGLGAPQGNIAS
jgi:anti-anti-sigma factor